MEVKDDALRQAVEKVTGVAEAKELLVLLKAAGDEEGIKRLSHVAGTLMERWMLKDPNLECLEESWAMVNYGKEVFTDDDMKALTITKENLKLKLPHRKWRG